MQLCPVLDPEFAINSKISRLYAILVHQKLRLKNLDFSEMLCLGFLLCCITKRASPSAVLLCRPEAAISPAVQEKGITYNNWVQQKPGIHSQRDLGSSGTSLIEAKKQHWRKYLMCFSYLSTRLPSLLKESLNFVSGIHQSSCPAVILWHITNKF